MANNAQQSGGSGHIFGVIYLFWILTHLNLLFSRHPLARMEPGTSFRLSVVANGREDIVDLWSKLDKSLPNSVITKEKADLTRGTVLQEQNTSQFKDSQGAEYSAGASITLRCRYGESQQTFSETFYIVDSCPFDALLRRNIKKGPLSDKPGYFPLKFGRQKEDESRQQDANFKDAEKRRRAETEAEREREKNQCLEDQQQADKGK